MNDFVRLIYFGLLKNVQELADKGIGKSVSWPREISLIYFKGKAEYKVLIRNRQVFWEYNRNLAPIYTLDGRIEYI